MYKRLYKRKWSLNHSFQNCKYFQNRLNFHRETTTRTWTRLCYLLPTGSSWCRHFRWKCKDFRGHAMLNFEVAIFSIIQDRRRRQRRTSTTALSKNASAFCLKISADAIFRMMTNTQIYHVNQTNRHSCTKIQLLLKSQSKFISNSINIGSVMRAVTELPDQH